MSTTLIVGVPDRLSLERGVRPEGSGTHSAVLQRTAIARQAHGGRPVASLAPRCWRLRVPACRHVGQGVLVEHVDEGAERGVEDLVHAAAFRLATARALLD